MYRDRYWNDAQFAAVSRLKEIADEAGVTLVELALRWVRDRPLTDDVLVGASSVEQLQANLTALAGPPLGVETREACDEVWPSLAGPAPDYNR
jgi:aryl-alcohol dehydrogenase-like predicted oxidoreductase